MKNPFDDAQEKSRNQKEFALQCCVVEQIPIWFPGLQFTAFPGRPGDAQDGFFKKKMGVKAGMSDLIFTWNDGQLRGGLIELKVDAPLAGVQNKLMSAWARLGWNTGVCKSCKQVFDALCKWGLQPASRGIREPDYRTEKEKFRDQFEMCKP